MFRALQSNKLVLIIVATLIAVMINIARYKLMLGAELTFGMSIALLTLFLSKKWWGLAVAIPANLIVACYNNKPILFIVPVIEIIILTYLCQDKKSNKILSKGYIILADLLFWLLLGSPAYFFYSEYIDRMDAGDSLIIAQKGLLNGVINILIAYSLFAINALIRNKRLKANQTISIEGISLVVIYATIVITALSHTIQDYNSMVGALATRLNSNFIKQGDYVLKTLNANSNAAQKSIVIDDLELFNKAYHLTLNQKTLAISNQNFFKQVEQDYIDVTPSTKISRTLATMIKYPNKIALVLPDEKLEKSLLKRFETGYWLVTLQLETDDDYKLVIARETKQEFVELLSFFNGALTSLTFCLLLGMVTSVTLSRILTREFLKVLDKHNANNNLESGEETERNLTSSPITEIHDLVDEVNIRTEKIRSDKQKIEALNQIAQQQLSTAGEIQQCFLGSKLNVQHKHDVSLFMRPAYNAGGDWYDAFEINDKIYIVVADVCDKGIGAALFMSVFRSLIRYSAETICRSSRADGVEPLNKVISTVNDYMSTEHADMTMFATVFFACVNPGQRKIDYVLAGHEMPILLDKNNNIQELSNSGPAIGLFPHSDYKVNSVQYERESLLLGFSDGVIDARDNDNESYGRERLIALLKTLRNQQAGLNSEMITRAIVQQLDGHIGEADQFDDITIAAIML